MADAQLTPPNYLKYAFKDQHNLVLLFGAACFSVAFASKLPLLVAGSAELLWLLVGPRLPAFRDWVDRQLSAQYLARAETAIESALGELSERDAQRFRALSRNATELLSSARGRAPARELQLAEHGLLELRRTFLDYSFLYQRLEALVDATPIADKEREVAQLQQSYSAERELTARMTIRKTLSALQLRISQQTALGNLKRNVELHLEMLEAALPYLKGRLADPACELFTQEIDTALAEIGPAEALELAVDEIFEQPPPSAGW
jgi:hypothetical protein